MSELKAYRFLGQDEVWPDANLGSDYYLKSEADKVIAEKDKELRRHKYKRCLAMADSLTWEFNYIVDYVSSDFPNIRFKRNHRLKWINKWLELAEQFKDNTHLVCGDREFDVCNSCAIKMYTGQTVLRKELPDK